MVVKPLETEAKTAEEIGAMLPADDWRRVQTVVAHIRARTRVTLTVEEHSDDLFLSLRYFEDPFVSAEQMATRLMQVLDRELCVLSQEALIKALVRAVSAWQVARPSATDDPLGDLLRELLASHEQRIRAIPHSG